MTDTVSLRRPHRRPRSIARRGAEMTVGALLMIFGPLIGGPIPGPFGFIGFVMGLALVLRNSRWARKRYIMLRRHYPKIARWTDLGLGRRKRRAAKPPHNHRQQRQQPQPENG